MDDNDLKYFAYGSNMSLKRLQNRVSSALIVGRFSLPKHRLLFHKVGRDGSAKCDAFHTGNAGDKVEGVLYKLAVKEKHLLDEAEGLGNGYEEKRVDIYDADGSKERAYMYYATNISDNILPFSWYVNHVVKGALQAGLPEEYLQNILNIRAISDPDTNRDTLERSVYK